MKKIGLTLILLVLIALTPSCAVTSAKLYDSALREFSAHKLEVAKKDKAKCYIASAWIETEAMEGETIKDRYVFTCHDTSFTVKYERLPRDPEPGKPEGSIPDEKRTVVNRLSAGIIAGTH